MPHAGKCCLTASYESVLILTVLHHIMLNFCLYIVELVCSNLYTSFFLYSKFVHEFLKFHIRIFSFVLILCTNLYANSYVNFVHEIPTKFVIFGRTWKVHMNSCKFVKVMLRMACTVCMLPGSTSQGDCSIKVTRGRTPRFLPGAVQLTKPLPGVATRSNCFKTMKPYFNNLELINEKCDLVGAKILKYNL